MSNDNTMLAKMRLKDFMAHLREQYEEALSIGKVEQVRLGLVAMVNQGIQDPALKERIVSTFSIEQFMGDIATLLDADEAPAIRVEPTTH